MTHTLRASLQDGAAALGLPLAEAEIDRLLAYLDLIQKWNKVYNLTAVRDPEEMVSHHLLDSLAVVPALLRRTGGRACTLADVGAGAGLPGVVIAACRPEIRVDCIDAVAKKAAFLRQVAAQLRLPNLRGVHARVETLMQPYDLVASRAFASLPDFVAWTSHLLADNGAWLAMKGRQPDEEIAALPGGVEVFHVEHLAVPQLGAQRCIVWMRRRAGAAAA